MKITTKNVTHTNNLIWSERDLNSMVKKEMTWIFVIGVRMGTEAYSDMSLLNTTRNEIFNIFSRILFLLFQPNPDAHKLTCQYSKVHPYFYLRPLKEEIMFLKPWIAVYHDVLVDKEIDRIKELAAPRVRYSHEYSITLYMTISKSLRLRCLSRILLSGMMDKLAARSPRTTPETSQVTQI